VRWAGPSFAVVALGCAPPEELVKRKMKKKKKKKKRLIKKRKWDLFLLTVGFVWFCFVYESSGFDGFSCSVSLFNLTVLGCKQKVEEKEKRERAAK
jgi:hypothetical protein